MMGVATGSPFWNQASSIAPCLPAPWRNSWTQTYVGRRDDRSRAKLQAISTSRNPARKPSDTSETRYLNVAINAPVRQCEYRSYIRRRKSSATSISESCNARTVELPVVTEVVMKIRERNHIANHRNHRNPDILKLIGIYILICRRFLGTTSVRFRGNAPAGCVALSGAHGTSIAFTYTKNRKSGPLEPLYALGGIIGAAKVRPACSALLRRFTAWLGMSAKVRRSAND